MSTQQQIQAEAIEYRLPREVMLWLASYLDVYAKVVSEEAAASLLASARHLREHANRESLH